MINNHFRRLLAQTTSLPSTSGEITPPTPPTVTDNYDLVTQLYYPEEGDILPRLFWNEGVTTKLKIDNYIISSAPGDGKYVLGQGYHTLCVNFATSVKKIPDNYFLKNEYIYSAEVKSTRIQSIGMNCFYMSSITSFSGSYIELLEVGCFEGTSRLTTFTAPKLDRIELTSLSGTGLVSLSLPNVTYVGSGGLAQNKNLETLSIPKIATGGESWCQGNENLTSISTLPTTFTKIAENAFSGCSKLPSITIQGTIEHVGHRAFAGCHRLQTISMTLKSTISTDITSTYYFGQYVFENCLSLTAANITGANLSVVPVGTFYNCHALPEISVSTVGAFINATTYQIKAYARCRA